MATQTKTPTKKATKKRPAARPKATTKAPKKAKQLTPVAQGAGKSWTAQQRDIVAAQPSVPLFDILKPTLEGYDQYSVAGKLQWLSHWTPLSADMIHDRSEHYTEDGKKWARPTVYAWMSGARNVSESNLKILSSMFGWEVFWWSMPLSAFVAMISHRWPEFGLELPGTDIDRELLDQMQHFNSNSAFGDEFVLLGLAA